MKTYYKYLIVSVNNLGLFLDLNSGLLMVFLVLQSFRWPRLAHHSVESAVLVSRILHGADGPVRLHQGVLTFHQVPVARFLLALYVAGVVIVHAIFERVLGWSLQFK